MTILSREIIKTADGSHTLAIPDMDEHYHSIHGAIQESRHVYIKSGLEMLNDREELSILEIGFGTGLNALLTLEWAINKDKNVSYTSLEKYPLQVHEYNLLNYGSLIQGELQSQFMKMHVCDWEKPVSVQPNFTLFKKEVDLLNFNAEESFDGIYFDAFAPDKQPDLWSASVFEKMFNCLNPKSFLLTYCAKGQVRRDMISAGFRVERIPGPPGKREILRAIKD